MNVTPMLAVTMFALALTTTTNAQVDEAEQLKMSALEALVSAPPERALPIVRKVLAGDGSTELKRRALFLLGQFDEAEATALLVETARSGDRALRGDAIRAIGIGGGTEAVAGLVPLYKEGDEEIRDAVMSAWLIADYAEGPATIAANTDDADEFRRAVDALAAMGATEALRGLRGRGDMDHALIDAYAIAGDVETLSVIARDGSDPARQAKALHGLAIADADDLGELVIGIYRSTDVAEVREAALQSLLIADADDAALRLYRESNDSGEKQRLLRLLVTMESDAVWDLIDATLEEDE